jgi:hypothetical protein
MRTHDRRGFALPAVIGALVIIGILVTAGFYTARQELRIGVASAHTNLAVNIAQAGANEVMANWTGYQLGNILPWEDTTVTDTIADGIWSVTIANANDYVYFLTATGEVTRGGDMWAGASRTIGISAKILFADINPPAALTTRGEVKIGSAAAQIIGNDYMPPTWAPYCTSVVPNDTTAVLVDDTMGGTNPSSGTKGLTGNPPYAEDSTIVDSTFTNFGDMDWAELVAFAQLDGKDITPLTNVINNTLPALTGTGQCDTDVLSNWGDNVPTNPCGSYFPLMYHSGDPQIQSTGYGQGILLVEGDLSIAGGYTFFGIIITQGTFTTGNGTNTIIGAVLASNAADLSQGFLGTSTIQYSQCAIQRAVLNNAALARARPLAERSWVDLSAAIN